MSIIHRMPHFSIKMHQNAISPHGIICKWSIFWKVVILLPAAHDLAVRPVLVTSAGALSAEGWTVHSWQAVFGPKIWGI